MEFLWNYTLATPEQHAREWLGVPGRNRREPGEETGFQANTSRMSPRGWDQGSAQRRPGSQDFQASIDFADWMKALTLAWSFLPGAASTPLDTSTP